MPEPAPDALARDAARLLGEAARAVSASRAPDRRERHRALVAEAIALAERARDEAAGAARRRALTTIAEAHAARAEDALHGAGQIALGSQRAPTPEACDDGWARVAEIVAEAEASARAAEEAARAIEGDDGARARAARAAAKAARAAIDASRLALERNHATTFHTSPGFSFGEGWYVAAAALFDGGPIQLEPGGPLLAQAERFLRDAGLAHLVVPYRPRPRANKAAPVVVARAFRADPVRAARLVRDAFLGDGAIAPAVRAFVDARVPGVRDRARVLLWVRDGVHDAFRNTRADELAELALRAEREGLEPVLVGDRVRGGPGPARAIDLGFFWKDDVFRGDDARRAQLGFFEHLRQAHGVVGQLGVTTAGMDGPALLGLPTAYLTDAPNVRLGAWVGAVPGYREIVRREGWLDDVRGVLAAWARAAR
jgi:hypothetical protein